MVICLIVIVLSGGDSKEFTVDSVLINQNQLQRTACVSETPDEGLQITWQRVRLTTETRLTSTSVLILESFCSVNVNLSNQLRVPTKRTPAAHMRFIQIQLPENTRRRTFRVFTRLLHTDVMNRSSSDERKQRSSHDTTQSTISRVNRWNYAGESLYKL